MRNLAAPRLIHAKPVPISWHPGLPVYASEYYLRTVGREYGWLGGFDQTEKPICILPYAIVRSVLFPMVRFRSEPIPLSDNFGVEEESDFLQSALNHFRSESFAVVLPAPTNAIFRTYPLGAIAAPYGTLRLDLTRSEEHLWNQIHPKHRNVIRSATKRGVVVREAPASYQLIHRLIRDTQARSNLGFMHLSAFEHLIASMGEQLKLFIAESEGAVQGCAVIPYSRFCAYYLYGGTLAGPISGAMNLLQWEMICRFRALGVRTYDFVGVRINPPKGSKQHGLLKFKERFGGALVPGYIWKFGLRTIPFAFYNLAVRLLRGGDIVDQEKHKLDQLSQSPVLPSLNPELP